MSPTIYQTIPPHALSIKKNELTYILSKAKAHLAIEKIILGLIDTKFKTRLHVANIHKQCLTLITSSACLATELRYQIPAILKNLHQNQHLQHIKSIECKVSPFLSSDPLPQFTNNPSALPMAHLSTQTAETIRTIAADLKDPKLKAIMERIAKRTTK